MNSMQVPNMSQQQNQELAGRAPSPISHTRELNFTPANQPNTVHNEYKDEASAISQQPNHAYLRPQELTLEQTTAIKDAREAISSDANQQFSSY